MRKFLSFLFTLLVIGGIVFFAKTHPEFCQKQLDKVQALWYVYKGDKALKKLKIQKAINFYTKAVRLYPEHYGAWYNLGNIYVVYEDYYSAVDAYEQAFEHNPKMIVAKMDYGVVSAEKLGDFDGAIKMYDNILNTKRTLITIPFVYSNRRSYKMNKGIAYYNRGVAYKQKSIYHGNGYEERKQYLFKALKSYKEAVKILKKDYDARYNLALAYHILGDYKKAGLTYCKAIELNPMKYEAHYNLAILLRHFKYYKESFDELEKAVTLVSSEGNGNSAQQRYIFDVMNDVTRTVLATEDNELIQRFFKYDDDETPPRVTYIHGRLVMSNDLDKAIFKNFQVCAAKKIFLEDIEDSFEDVRTDVNVPGVDMEENTVERFKQSNSEDKKSEEQEVKEETQDVLDPQAEFDKIRAEEHFPELDKFNNKEQSAEEKPDMSNP